ncbi:MAG: DUF485 domain-containing protein [Comamonadaceae bacterium]|nr:DUF485 domain-containing protein [Comamonadaceae bacterium]
MNRPRSRDRIPPSCTRGAWAPGCSSLYALVYAGFVVVNLVRPGADGEGPSFGGLNLAVVYGFGLIIFALILALIYSRACGRRRSASARPKPEGGRRMNVLSIVLFVLFVAFVLGISFYFAGQGQVGQRLLRRRRPDPLGRQRHRLRRRLPVGGLVPGHLRHDRHGRLRRLPLLHRLPGRLDRRPVHRRRAAQAPGQVHLHRRPRRQLQLTAASSSWPPSAPWSSPSATSSRRWSARASWSTPLLGLPHAVGRHPRRRSSSSPSWPRPA